MNEGSRPPSWPRRPKWQQWVPALERARVLRRARPHDIGADVVAGVAVAALLVPHGLAYAELAGVPAVTGLYTTVAALLAYAVFGPSRILMLGPDSSLAPLIAASLVLVGADDDPSQAIAAAGMLALLTGVLCMGAGVARLGAIAELLSRPVRVGYLNGLAIVMIVSQLPKLAGFSVSGETTLAELVDFIQGLGDGLADGTALLVGLGCLVVIVFMALRFPRMPGVLVAMVGATVVVAVFDLAAEGVPVVGEVPDGFPAPAWPGVEPGDIPELLISAAGVALLTLSDTTALSRGFGARSGDMADPNHEIIALGAANVATGFFQGFPVSASTSRTTVAEASGGRTQLLGVVGAVLVLALLVGGGGLVEDLPSAGLAAVVIAAGLKLFDLASLRWLARVRRTEFLLSVAASLGVVVIGVLEGIVVATLLSLGNFVRRLWRPYDAVLGRIEQRKGYHDVERNPQAQQIPGLLLFRFDAPIFFANADHFARRLFGEIDRADGPIREVILAAEPVTDIDTTGAEVLARVLQELEQRGIDLTFAELKGPVRDRLRRYGLYDVVGDAHFQPTLGTAIDFYLDRSGVDWVDWTDRARERGSAADHREDF